MWPFGIYVAPARDEFYRETAPLLRSSEPEPESELLQLIPMSSPREQIATTQLGETAVRDDDSPTSPAPRMPKLTRGTPLMSRKAALSAYMAIAASAFGLISDGCECLPRSSRSCIRAIDLWRVCRP